MFAGDCHALTVQNLCSTDTSDQRSVCVDAVSGVRVCVMWLIAYNIFWLNW
jgi:hypothetical protein